MTILAHAGHWAVGLIYFMPVVIVAAVIVVQNRRDKRSGAEEESDEPSLDDILDGRDS